MSERGWRDVGQVGARVARRSVTEAERRVARLRERALFIVQCAVAAGLAWFVARDVLEHPAPLFAPITAIICLGLSYGQRVKRAFELMIGVALGVIVGDLFVQIFGAGTWQVVLVVLVAMAAAALLGSGQLITTQAGVQALFVITYAANPSQGFSRWLDAVVGGTIAIVFAAVVPRAHIQKPRGALADLLVEVSDLLKDDAMALQARDVDTLAALLEQGRATESTLTQLRQISAEAVAIVRQSPLQRRQAPEVQNVVELVAQVDMAVRTLRVLLRRTFLAVRMDEPVPPTLPGVLTSLGVAVREVAFAVRRDVEVPEAARAALLAVAATTTTPAETGLSAEVVRAQVRSLVVDLLVVTGMDYDAALDAVVAATHPH